ncbi:MAG: PEP-CTERM system TPR-repeat protein PrsT, partial [Gammaproteobacteria bacterium]|nr:PEP-CTERM system TPR-repeat protein PrsT [Gammaproteobacteria bacterium]
MTLNQFNMATLYKLLISIFLFIGLSACADKSDVEYLQLGQQYNKSGELRSAIIELKNALQQNPKNSDARQLLGEIYVEFREGAAAEKELRRAAELGVKPELIAIPLAKALLYQQKHQPIIDELGQATDMGKANETWRATLLGEAYLGLQNLEQAQQHFSSALQNEADFVPALLGQAKMHLTQNDHPGAQGDIEKALSLDPENLDAWTLKGELEFLGKHYAEAQKAFEKALKLNEESPIVTLEFTLRSKLAHTLLAENNTKDAIQHIDRLLKISPEHPLPQYLRGLAAYLDRNRDLAAKHFQNVLKSAPRHQPSIFLMGAINYDEDNLEQAEMYLSSFVAAVPSHPPARKLLAATRLKLERPEQAMEAVNPLLAENPSDPQLLSFMSRAALSSGDPKRSAGYLQKAVAAQPDDASLKTSLAKVYLSTGDADK